MLGLDDIHKTRCVLIYPINKMYAIPEKKQGYQMIKLKYTVRNSKKTKEHTYDFRHSVVTDD